MFASLVAIAVAVLGIAGSAIWFGISRRRTAETDLGIHALANMKWREGVAVLLEMLRSDGYRLSADAHSVGDGGTEFLLSKDDEKVLLGYKHGTAYRLNDASVRDFSAAVGQRGAASGILLTLGLADAGAVSVAMHNRIELIPGPALWPRVRDFVPAQLLEKVQDNAANEIRKGLWFGSIVSVVVAAVVYFALASDLLSRTQTMLAAASAEAPSEHTKADNRASTAPVAAPNSSDVEMIRQLNATAQAMAEVAKLSPDQLAARRAEVARTISLMAQVDTAAWSAQQTMLVSLNRTDGRDVTLLNEICRTVTQYEELRFTRLQLEPPSNSGLRVRWRLCD